MPTPRRVKELVTGKWSEFKFEKRIWHCPAVRMKGNATEDHRVPLSDQCIELLNRIPRKTEFVFQSPNAEEPKHISKETPRIVLCHLLHRNVTMHGCRSLFTDWCAEKGVNPELSEKALAHETGNKVRQAYKRSDLLEQRRAVMQAYADDLLHTKKGSTE